MLETPMKEQLAGTIVFGETSYVTLSQATSILNYRDVYFEGNADDVVKQLAELLKFAKVYMVGFVANKVVRALYLQRTDDFFATCSDLVGLLEFYTVVDSVRIKNSLSLQIVLNFSRLYHALPLDSEPSVSHDVLLMILTEDRLNIRESELLIFVLRWTIACIAKNLTPLLSGGQEQQATIPPIADQFRALLELVRLPTLRVYEYRCLVWFLDRLSEPTYHPQYSSPEWMFENVLDLHTSWDHLLTRLKEALPSPEKPEESAESDCWTIMQTSPPVLKTLFSHLRSHVTDALVRSVRPSAAPQLKRCDSNYVSLDNVREGTILVNCIEEDNDLTDGTATRHIPLHHFVVVERVEPVAFVGTGEITGKEERIPHIPVARVAVRWLHSLFCPGNGDHLTVCTDICLYEQPKENSFLPLNLAVAMLEERGEKAQTVYWKKVSKIVKDSKMMMLQSVDSTERAHAYFFGLGSGLRYNNHIVKLENFVDRELILLQAVECNKSKYSVGDIVKVVSVSRADKKVLVLEVVSKEPSAAKPFSLRLPLLDRHFWRKNRAVPPIYTHSKYTELLATHPATATWNTNSVAFALVGSTYFKDS